LPPCPNKMFAGAVRHIILILPPTRFSPPV